MRRFKIGDIVRFKHNWYFCGKDNRFEVVGVGYKGWRCDIVALDGRVRYTMQCAESLRLLSPLEVLADAAE